MDDQTASFPGDTDQTKQVQKDSNQDPDQLSASAVSGQSGSPHDDQATSYQNVSLKPEEKEAIGSLYKEGEPAVIERKEFKIPKEIKEYVEEEKKEEAIQLPQPIKDEYGEILMQSARPQKPRIVLPLNKKEIKTNVGKKVSDSIKWLAIWCKRLLKMFPKRVSYGGSVK